MSHSAPTDTMRYGEYDNMITLIRIFPFSIDEDLILCNPTEHVIIPAVTPIPDVCRVCSFISLKIDFEIFQLLK